MPLSVIIKPYFSITRLTEKIYSIEQELKMAISYKKLWKMLIDRDLKKKDLEKMAGISHYTISKLNHGDNVTTDTLLKICTALDCQIDDIMEITNEK